MKGHVSTPDDLAEHMVERLFFEISPEEGDRILYPGVGSRAPFVQAVENYCRDHGHPVPNGVGVELDPDRIADARDHLNEHVELYERDFLSENLPTNLGQFKYVIGNPPYVPIERLSREEKRDYRARFSTAIERFDLYLLFYERALNFLEESGRLVFVTPEKYEYVSTASPLRQKLTSSYHIRRIEHLPENEFGQFITYPAITTVDRANHGSTHIHRRNGTRDEIVLPSDGSSWASYIRKSNGPTPNETGVTLSDITVRVSPGIATGRDGIYVIERDKCPPQLLDTWTYPTVSGRQLENHGPNGPDIMIVPYDECGNLIPEEKLGPVQDWAELHRGELESRSCVKNGKVWYAFHESAPLDDILNAKILCKDMAESPEFWIDKEGEIVPRHTVYYIVPKDRIDLHDLSDYLNSPEVSNWLYENCQKAHNDYLRLQSNVLNKLPVPQQWGDTVQQKLT
jgi:hypothetical protein